jgi:hypothetical protein
VTHAAGSTDDRMSIAFADSSRDAFASTNSASGGAPLAAYCLLHVWPTPQQLGNARQSTHSTPMSLQEGKD